jgi:hypothetical protein
MLSVGGNGLAEVKSGLLPILDQNEGENHLVVDVWNLSSTVWSVDPVYVGTRPLRRGTGAIAWMWGSEVDLSA